MPKYIALLYHLTVPSKCRTIPYQRIIPTHSCQHTDTNIPLYHTNIPYDNTDANIPLSPYRYHRAIPPCYNSVSYTENIPHTGIHGYTRSTEGQSDWSRRCCYHGNKKTTTPGVYLSYAISGKSCTLTCVCVCVCVYVCICMIFVFIISCVCCC